MMDDCIYREAVLALLKDDREVCADSKEELKYIRADIRAIPAADVRPVVRGKWIRNGWSIRCSECGYDMPFSVRNFCPNCGADMRSEERWIQIVCKKCGGKRFIFRGEQVICSQCGADMREES